MKIPEGLQKRDGVVIDTTVFIYLFEDHPRYGLIAEYIIEQIENNIFKAVITPVTVAEIIVKPLSLNRPDLADRCRNALHRFKNITIVDFSYKAGELAGALKAAYNLPLPDMIQAAISMQYSSPALITNDKAMASIKEIDVYQLNMFI